MTTLHAAAGALGTTRRVTAAEAARGVLVSIATALALLAGVLLLLLTPIYVHAALDAAGSAQLLGVAPVEARALSDRTVDELLFGPGSFAFTGPDGQPFYDASEQAHMRDVRLVLYSFLGIGALGALGVAVALSRRRDRPTVAAVGRGGAALVVGLVVVGAVALVAFNVAFELFHMLLFPAGSWAFDPQSQRLVQLYPLAFWQISAAALGGLGIVAGGMTWLLARRATRATRSAAVRRREP